MILTAFPLKKISVYSVEKAITSFSVKEKKEISRNGSC